MDLTRNRFARAFCTQCQSDHCTKPHDYPRVEHGVWNCGPYGHLSVALTFLNHWPTWSRGDMRDLYQMVELIDEWDDVEEDPRVERLREACDL